MTWYVLVSRSGFITTALSVLNLVLWLPRIHSTCFSHSFFFFFFLFSLFILREREREREREQGRGREKGRERERENLKQAPHCQPRARCGAGTHEPSDHDLSQNKRVRRSTN